MGISTWKVLTALSIGLIVFAVYVSVADVQLGPREAIGTFLLAMLFGGITYVTLRFGYRIGNRLGPDNE